MKGSNDYKKLAPIVMGAILIFCIFGRVKAAKEESRTYDDYIESARKYREEKIYATSKEEYDKALDLDDSLNLYCEIAEMLIEEDNPTKIEKWCEDITEKFPDEPAGYEYLIEHYIKEEKYSKCFEIYDIVTRRNIVSEKIEKDIISVKYKYKIDKNRYDSVSDFVGGYAVFCEDGEYGLISQKGDVVLNHIYSNMAPTDGRHLAVTDSKGESYYIDLNGDRRFNLPEGADTERLGKIYGDIIPVWIDNKFYYYSAADGIQLLGPFEDGVPFANGVAAVMEGGKWYIISPDGTKLTEAYDSFYVNEVGAVASGGYVFAHTNKGYIMLDPTMQKVGSGVYEDVKGFVDGTFAAVKKDGKWGFVDTNGNYIIKPKYEDAFSFANGLAPVKSGGSWGFINSDDKWAIEPTFVDAKALNSNGCGFVIEENSTEWNLIKFVEFNY
ncbi:WG repeat-containing protein [Butyrivibrio sp. JL13D10]|uniref:WG repeat-containing protein n=1 Tax=Butyrivibrio sp. JL13D10 TaxID=3236815 RepID=UPI0038B550DD